MKAYTEWLYKPGLIMPDAVGLLRVGPHAEKYGDPYDGFTTFKVVQGVVDVKGLQNYLGRCPTCGCEIHLSKAHVAAGLHELRRVTGLDIHWTHKGKESFMSAPKKDLAHSSAIFNADGSPNFDAMFAQAKDLHEQHSAGHIRIGNGSVSQSSIPGGQRVSIAYDVIG